jgi:Co/Zn/Cd efflux system component
MASAHEQHHGHGRPSANKRRLALTLLLTGGDMLAVVVGADARHVHLLTQLRSTLHERFGIDHVTIQIESFTLLDEVPDLVDPFRGASFGFPRAAGPRPEFTQTPELAK